MPFSLLLAGLLALFIQAPTVAKSADNAERPNTIADCNVLPRADPIEVKVLDTSFDVRLRDRATIEGQCAPYVRAHVMGHVYFSGGAAASIDGDGALITRSSDRSVAKASEIVRDGLNHSLIYAALVAPLKLVGRKDAKYVGVFEENGKWVIAAFQTDVDGRILTLKKFMISDQEIIAIGYFPHPHLPAGTLGLTVREDGSSARELLTFHWTHRDFG